MGILGTLPSWLDFEFVKTASAALAIFAFVMLVVVIFLVRSVGTRIVIVIMLGAAVFGLLHYRQTLDDCQGGHCSCKLLGEDLKGGDCTPTG